VRQCKIPVLITKYNKLTPNAKTLELKLDSIEFRALLIKVLTQQLTVGIFQISSPIKILFSQVEDIKNLKNLYQKIGNVEQKF